MSSSPISETTVDQPIAAAATQPHVVPPHAPDPSQGKSIASWVVVYVILSGAVCGMVGLISGYPWISWSGRSVAVFWTGLGRGLEEMGFGRRSDEGANFN